jgi:cysteine desulfurase
MIHADHGKTILLTIARSFLPRYDVPMREIYLDYNASTPIDPGVAAAMEPFLSSAFGNPSSLHWSGKPAREAIENAREEVGASLGAAADEIVFTSGGTEANNLAIKGVFFSNRARGNHIITSAVEHPAVIEPCRFLESLGASVTILPVDSTGRVNPDDLARAIRPETILVSIMHANNEVGTIQPIAECSAIARTRGVLFHTDAAQSFGKIPVSADSLGADLVTIAGHKLYAPKGVGALYVRRGTLLAPHMHGAGHEAGRRAGTESALLVSGLAAACVLARDLTPMVGVETLRDAMWEGLAVRLGQRVVLNGHPSLRLPNTLNLAFPGQIGAELLAKLDGIAASTGSACHSGVIKLSPTLAAMGIPPEVGMGAIRFSLGRATTRDEIDYVVDRVCAVLNQG